MHCRRYFGQAGSGFFLFEMPRLHAMPAEKIGDVLKRMRSKAPEPTEAPEGPAAQTVPGPSAMKRKPNGTEEWPPKKAAKVSFAAKLETPEANVAALPAKGKAQPPPALPAKGKAQPPPATKGSAPAPPAKGKAQPPPATNGSAPAATAKGKAQPPPAAAKGNAKAKAKESAPAPAPAKGTAAEPPKAQPPPAAAKGNDEAKAKESAWFRRKNLYCFFSSRLI